MQELAFARMTGGEEIITGQEGTKQMKRMGESKFHGTSEDELSSNLTTKVIYKKK